MVHNLRVLVLRLGGVLVPNSWYDALGIGRTFRGEKR